MSRKVNSSKLDLKLNLSPPTTVNSPNKSVSCRETPSPETDQSSCVSSEEGETTSSGMILVGCPRCLMYIMVPEADPKCPKCKNTTMLLDFLSEANSKKTAT